MRMGRLAFTVSCYQSPLGPQHYQCRAHDTRRPLQKRADSLQFRVLLRENQLDELSERSGSDQQCMDERLARFSRLCEEDATLNQLRLAAVVAADDLASATDGCDALDNCSSVCSGLEPNVYWAERARLAAQAGISVNELVKREYKEGMAANAAVRALAVQAGITVEQLEYHSGITHAELKKKLAKGEYDEGMAADTARNVRLWDEGMAAYTAANARLERGGGRGQAKRELFQDAEKRSEEDLPLWIEILRAEDAASEAAHDAQEAGFEAFLSNGEEQAATAWVSDDDVFDPSLDPWERLP